MYLANQVGSLQEMELVSCVRLESTPLTLELLSVLLVPVEDRATPMELLVSSAHLVNSPPEMTIANSVLSTSSAPTLVLALATLATLEAK